MDHARATADQLEHLVLMATYAPSVHNTQPWAFVRTDEGLLLRADRSRQLSVLDPYGRDLLLSCGAALHHLQVAARAIGLDAHVDLLPDEAQRPEGKHDDLARIRVVVGEPASALEQETAVAVLHRHTYRGRFPSDDVGTAPLEQLRIAVEAQHAMLRVVRADELVELEVLVSVSERTLLQTPGYAAELDRWVWHQAEGERGDGLPPDAVDPGTGRAESVAGRRFTGRDVVAAPAGAGDAPVAEHPTVVLLTSTGDEPGDWLQAGRALSALLLAATSAHLLVQPIGQVVDVPQTRWAVQQALGLVGVPQMMLRIGAGDAVATSPRRAVGEVYAGT